MTSGAMQHGPPMWPPYSGMHWTGRLTVVETPNNFKLAADLDTAAKGISRLVYRARQDAGTDERLCGRLDKIDERLRTIKHIAERLRGNS